MICTTTRFAITHVFAKFKPKSGARRFGDVIMYHMVQTVDHNVIVSCNWKMTSVLL